MTDKEFIDYISPLAIKDMGNSGILASITIAQACLESGYGRGELAINACNFFGMKCLLSGNTWESVWDKSQYTKTTQEENTDGKTYFIKSNFRRYPNIENSIKDHSLYLSGAKNGTVLRFDGIIGEKDYKKVISIIKNGGYATDSKYIEKICNIIKKWDLTKFDYEVNKMKINKLLTPYNHSIGTIDRIKYIVIHYVGATGGAKANCEYYASQYVGASAHYYVGFDGEVWQSVEDHNTAWHCGTKGAYVHPECRNANSIGIEMCVRNKGDKSAESRDWYFEDATVQATIELTKELMEKYGIDAAHVIRHHDVTGKICPNPYVYNHTKHTWAAFKAALDSPEVASSSWEKDTQGRYRYKEGNGAYAANKWLLINRHWYLFGEDGYMLTGWQHTVNGDIVSPGEPGEWYFLDNTPGGPLEGACWHSTDYGAMEIWEV